MHILPGSEIGLRVTPVHFLNVAAYAFGMMGSASHFVYEMVSKLGQTDAFVHGY
jgi:hypothetical protein